jgi:LPS sulfotransferase NodH
MTSIGALIRQAREGPSPESNAKLDPRVRSYVILFTARSGSSWISDALTKTTELGVVSEYFNPDFVPNLAKAVQAYDEHDFLIKLCSTQCSGNKIFGVKTTSQQLDLFSEVDPIEFFADRFAGAKFFLLRRKELVEQAISLYAAEKTAYFHSFMPGGVPAIESEKWDEAHILSIMRQIVSEEVSLELKLQARKIEPIRLFYEDIIDRENEVVGVFFNAVLNRRFTGAASRSSIKKLERRGSQELISKFSDACSSQIAFLDSLRPPFDPVVKVADVASRQAYVSLFSNERRPKYLQLTQQVGRGFVFYSNEDMRAARIVLVGASANRHIRLDPAIISHIGEEYYTCLLPDDVFDGSAYDLRIEVSGRVYVNMIDASERVVGCIDFIGNGAVKGWVSAIGPKALESEAYLTIDGVRDGSKPKRFATWWSSAISNTGGHDGIEWVLSHDVAGTVRMMYGHDRLICESRGRQ